MALLDFRVGDRPPFFLDIRQREETVDRWLRSFPKASYERLIEDADRICRHEFDLLGSGLHQMGEVIDWHVDFKTGAGWDPILPSKLQPRTLPDPGSDIKVPWELSRFQHLPTLGKAYWLTNRQEYAREFVDQFVDWHHKNPPEYGVNWMCTMDVAIRAVNLIWAFHFFRDADVFSDDVCSRFLCAMEEHGRFICGNLEYGYSGGQVVTSNHFLADILGLVYLGLSFPEFKDSGKWRRIGIAGLVQSMDQQVLSDGSNFESSIPYHRLVLECFTSAARLCEMNRVELPSTFSARLEEMFEYVQYYTRPDGLAPQVGDADDGRLHILSKFGGWDRRDHRYLQDLGACFFNKPGLRSSSTGVAEEAFWLMGADDYARIRESPVPAKPVSSRGFPDAASYILRSGDDYCLISAGRVGTAGIGNHKHNDVLSFEISVGGVPIVVDPGSFLYTGDPDARNRFRSTASHNTVVIDGREQNRFLNNELFTMYETANPVVRYWSTETSRDVFDAEHNGFSTAQTSVVHRRRFLFEKQSRRWTIDDYLTGAGEHTATWYFHFDPGVCVVLEADGSALASAGPTFLKIRLPDAEGCKATLREGLVSPRYGIVETCFVLEVESRFEGSLTAKTALTGGRRTDLADRN